jgi:putative hemolysin
LRSGKPPDLEAALPAAPAMPENVDAVPLVLVHDEHGQLEGLVTPGDILEAVAGAFKSDIGAEEPDAAPARGWFLASLRIEACR